MICGGRYVVVAFVDVLSSPAWYYRWNPWRTGEDLHDCPLIAFRIRGICVFHGPVHYHHDPCSLDLLLPSFRLSPVILNVEHPVKRWTLG